MEDLTKLLRKLIQEKNNKKVRLNIYFSGSIYGGRQKLDTYKKLKIIPYTDIDEIINNLENILKEEN